MEHIRNDLFATDLTAWYEAQALALRDGRFGDLDHERLSGLIGELAAERRQALRAHLGIVLTALLRWAEQVDLRNGSWAASINIQRYRIAAILAENPGLVPRLPVVIAAAYPEARARAVLESDLPDDSFPAACPFTDAEILRVGYMPDPYGDDAIRGVGWWKDGSP
ncbi:DUF29 domain-containing protein [Methylobacterium sp. A54F]